MSEIEPCTRLSVGILVNLNDTLLLIERKKFPFGFAPPAGHVDPEEDHRDAAIRELREEVGIGMGVFYGQRRGVGGSFPNRCRLGSGWHHWIVYETSTNTADVVPSPDEVASVRWATPGELAELADRTRAYLAGEVTEEEWVAAPGLEPVWLEMLTQAGWIE